MSGKAAKVYTHQSNRAKRGGTFDAEKKVVFKSVLDTPYRVKWPSIPLNVQNTCLACLLTMFKGVAEYHRNRPSRSRKRKREENNGSSKRQKLETEATDVALSNEQSPAPNQNVSLNLNTSKSPQRPPPEILNHVTIGINEVTKRLEDQIRSSRKSVRIAPGERLPAYSDSVPPSKPHLWIVVVCRLDVDPPILIDHIPHLVAAYNSIPVAARTNNETFTPVKLITLPKGSEISLAEAFGLRRVSVLAIEGDTTALVPLLPVIDRVPTLAASWLGGEAPFIPTHVKHLKTTAPKDIKIAKEARTKGRMAAKEEKKDAGIQKTQSKIQQDEMDL